MPDIKLTPMHAGQQAIYRNRGARNVIRCGRRYGKTTMFETWSCNWSMHGKRVGFFAPSDRLLMPSYDRILRTVLPAKKSASKTAKLIELVTGGCIEFWTLADEDAGRSRFYDEVIIDEASLVPGLKDIFEQSIAPTLLDRNGNATMGGTPKGIDEDSYFYQACTNKTASEDWPETWKEFYAPTSANPMLNAAAVLALKNKYPALVYSQEYLAEFVSWAGQSLLSLDKMLVDGAGVALPHHCDYVFAVIDSAVKDGKEHDGTAVVYFAKSSLIGHPLVVLDWDLIQVTSNLLPVWLPQVFKNLEMFAKTCRARAGTATYIEDKASGSMLIQHAQAEGWPAEAIPGDLTAVGKDARALASSGPVYRGEVKLSQQAFDKVTTFKGVTRNHLIAQTTGYAIGDKAAATRADDVSDCVMYGILLGLGSSEGF